MTLIRGRGLGLAIMLAGRDIDSALVELQAKLTERPGFYRGSPAVAIVGPDPLSDAQADALRAVLAEGGIELTGLEQAGEELARRRALRPRREMRLSESAKSLVADFAGARADIAERRKRGEASVRRLAPAAASPEPAAAAEAAAPVAPVPGTHYHVGTLRGGQALHHVGNIVVVGDVNPGAELIASGDIVVVGALRGTAHAGAQGDRSARVIALEFAPTQLRIATVIGADALLATGPQQATIEGDRIAVTPLGAATRQEISI